MWDTMEPGRCLADKDIVLTQVRLAGRKSAVSPRLRGNCAHRSAIDISGRFATKTKKGW